ncbi:MAG TPA: HD domain-containing phosphohydrolase [Candidatus Hydrogenedentes bacterium]|nr:HD domain-containing phosphohydrolase [Candidatus Hydrogenedentota bacterium]HOS02929.1 HD domain-containing phosphohydrolase [Candidatus Hydrogenedentota bacterium]
MLKRIAVVGTEATLGQTLAEASSGKGIEVTELGAAAAVPPTVSAVIGGTGAVEEVVRVASIVGLRHEELLYLLAEALDCRETFAQSSSKRVKEHATRFAIALGLDESDQLLLERGALVRDIGKLRISNDVLLKASVLTYDEWIQIQGHPTKGGEIVAQIDALKDVEEIIRHHHECWDGTGYPNQIEGEAIPYLARAMRILDVYCAMTSPRHYRKGTSTHEDALAYLRSERGKHFDPKLVDAFVDGNVGRAE